MSHQLCALSSPVVVCVRWPLFQLDLAIRLDRCVVACHCCHILPPAFVLLSWPQLHFSRHHNRQHPVESATLIEEFDKSAPIRREFFTPTSSTILREGGSRSWGGTTTWWCRGWWSTSCLGLGQGILTGLPQVQGTVQSRQGQYYEAILSRTVEFKVRRPAYGSRSYQGQESPTRTGRGRGQIHYYAHYQSVFSWLLRMEKTLHFTFSTWISLIYFVYTAWIWLLFFVFCFCGWFVEYYLGFTFFWSACFCTFCIFSTYTGRNEKRSLFICYYAHYRRGFYGRSGWN